MLPVTSAIQSDILHLYLRAVDVYINILLLYMDEYIYTSSAWFQRNAAVESTSFH